MSADSEIIVEIPQGKLRGKRDKTSFGEDFFRFHRIPYAKPPVGELRFKAPQPAEKWSGILDATEEGTVCPSANWGKDSFLKESSEDSLFINVYCKRSPNVAGRKKSPVVVWFHGGGFEFGSGNSIMSGPDYFMFHDVVLVTFNYRLGVLGFLSLQTVKCSGNFGLKDQQLALKWVNHNIAHFGGDPDNITILGISAGAASVHYQTLCLANKGLFKRAIAQSGASTNPWALARHQRENAFALGRRMGCDTKDDDVLLEFLRKAPVEEIVMKGLGVIIETEGEALGQWFFNFTFVPTIEPEHEGAFITQHPWVLMKEGKYLDVPLITGVTSDEMLTAVKGVDDYPRFTRTEDFQQFIPKDIQLPKNTEKALAIAKRIKEFYFKDGVNLNNYINILSDYCFNYGVFRFVKCRTTNSKMISPTYLYYFTYEGHQPLLKKMLQLNVIKGATHGDDTGYLFKTGFSNMEEMRPGLPDYNFMMKITKLWVNYATSGVPTLDDPGFAWKKTDNEHLEYLELGSSILMKKGFLKDRMKFWDEIYTSYFDGSKENYK